MTNDIEKLLTSFVDSDIGDVGERMFHAYIMGDVPRVYYDGVKVMVEIIPHDEFWARDDNRESLK